MRRVHRAGSIHTFARLVSACGGASVTLLCVVSFDSDRPDDEAAIERRILELVTELQQRRAKRHVFVPGVTTIPYAGRVYDGDEVRAAVKASLDFWLTLGPEGEALERELARFLGVKHATLVNSGSSANLLALTALTSDLLDRPIVPGDEVITVAAGFPTTVNPIVQTGCIPVFVDIDRNTGNVDASRLEAARSDRTRAVMLAHALGNPFDLDAVTSFCRAHSLHLIEDNCDALGSTYRGKMTGSFGDLATSSFYPAHHMTTGEGGAVYSRSAELRRIVESFRDWGRDCWCSSGKDNTCGKRFAWPWESLPWGYDHKYVYRPGGYNLKPTDIQAAIGLAQIRKVPAFVEARRRNWRRLRELLDPLGRLAVRRGDARQRPELVRIPDGPARSGPRSSDEDLCRPRSATHRASQVLRRESPAPARVRARPAPRRRRSRQHRRDHAWRAVPRGISGADRRDAPGGGRVGRRAHTVRMTVARVSQRDLDHCLSQAERALRELRGERILLTGGTGFFGRWLLETLSWANRRLSLGARVTVLTRDPERFRANSPHLAEDAAVTMHRGDVRDFAAPTGTHAFVLHCATSASKAMNEGAPLEMVDVICSGTRHALDVAASLGCKRFLLASSGAVYGRQPPDVTHLAEDHAGGPDQTDPRSAYAEAKRLAELLCTAHGLGRAGGAAVFARGFAFIGPHLPRDAHFAMGNFIGDALARPAITVHGDGEPHRSYLYAADLAAWLWVILVFGLHGRAYNVGSEDSMCLRDVALAVGKIAAKPVEVHGAAVSGAPASRYVPSTARARAELGLEQRIPLDDAIRRTLAFYSGASIDD